MPDITKQLHINRLALPNDVLNEIKNYSFYDAVTGDTRIQKREIVKNIHNAITVEKEKSMFFWMSEKEHRERYWFLAGEIEGWSEEDIVFLKCRFCETCGNYTQTASEDMEEGVSVNAWCYCDLPPLIPNIDFPQN